MSYKGELYKIQRYYENSEDFRKSGNSGLDPLLTP